MPSELSPELQRLIAAEVAKHLQATAPPPKTAVFDMVFSGPASNHQAAMRSIVDAGFPAATINPPHGEASEHAETGEVDDDGNPVLETDTERGKRLKAEQRRGWLRVETTTGQVPTGDEQANLMNRALEALRRHGYELRTHGINWQRREVTGG